MENNKYIKITKENTLIILDYDDTLFPTSYVMKNNINLYDIEVRNRYIIFFSELDQILYKLLKQLQDYGTIVVISNALIQWIKLSSLVIPNTRYLLSKIKVVSAKQKYMNVSNDMMDWKKLAFRDEISDKKIFNVISIGDMDCEYNALINLHNINRPKLLKSVKLLMGPDYDTLTDQLEVLTNLVPQVCMTTGYLDMSFKKTNLSAEI